MKEFIVEYKDIRRDGENVVLDVRVGQDVIRLGDYMGGRKVLKIEGYGKDMLQTYPHHCCCITLDGMPMLMVQECDPDWYYEDDEPYMPREILQSRGERWTTDSAKK